MKFGQSNTSLKPIQEALAALGLYNMVIDGIWGNGTHKALLDYIQEYKNDFILSEDLQTAILTRAKEKSKLFEPNKKAEKITQIHYQEAAKDLGVTLAHIKAIAEVEAGSRKSGFLPSGRVIILFEAHVFWSELAVRRLNVQFFANQNPDILSPKWNRNLYVGGEGEHPRLAKAMNIHREAALCSASYGIFQIMGFNWWAAGFNSVEHMASSMQESEVNQLKGLTNFIKSNPNMLAALARQDWHTFAKAYNGAGYLKNGYHLKIQAAYEKYKKV